jgi:tetratricopeptide (TPR) repeat protein
VSSARAYLLVSASVLAAMDGQFEEARASYQEALALLEALGREVGAAAITTWTSGVELLADDPEEAESQLRAALERLEAAGELANLASVWAQLAEALVRQERHDEALVASEASERAASEDDLHAQIAWRVARAKAFVGLQRADDALVVADQALELAGRTDSPVFKAEALGARAAALAATGAAEDSQADAREALGLHQAKGNRVAAAGIQAIIDRGAAARASSTGR